MPQFYFDMKNGMAERQADATGLAFASILEARAHAMTLLPVIGVELPMNEGEFRTWTVVVRDAGNTIVCRLIMAIINDALTPGAARILSPIRPPDDQSSP